MSNYYAIDEYLKTTIVFVPLQVSASTQELSRELVRRGSPPTKDDEQLREPKCSIHRFRFVPCLLLALGYAKRSPTDGTRYRTGWNVRRCSEFASNLLAVSQDWPDIAVNVSAVRFGQRHRLDNFASHWKAN
jgi:hypothetical protein